MTKFYYYIDPEANEVGPVEVSFFKEHNINPKSLIWFEGLPMWVEAHTVSQLEKFLNSKEMPSFACSNNFIDIDEFKRETPYIKTLKDSQKSKYISPAPRTWLFESILVTLFCTLPLGIVAIIYSSRVKILWDEGIYAQSVKCSNLAGRWVKISLLVAVIFWLIYFIFYWSYPGVITSIDAFNKIQ